MSESDYEAFEPNFRISEDPAFSNWTSQLGRLPSSALSIRLASATAPDGRRLKDLQIVCSPISVRSVRENASTINDERVLIAEIDGVHVGFCISTKGSKASDPMFLQVVAVAPGAQRRGVGIALMTAAAAYEPERDIVLATQDDNLAARALNEKYARSIGAKIYRVRISAYRNKDLGIQRGMGYRAWAIQRPTLDSERTCAGTEEGNPGP
ncbi:GNAT family N-acetyltransferase [Paenarthrobacter nitroguajacolicus]|uniref:GNAT family N-acetyltransferase n=1 Tax=Paenarthrobacter nitroguajacolicus TaxID=211146 RepID=UPI0028556773|nr:GNAT family N-acetyltransferase [Paenarthrobacter nitroguajacolicus]MDR6639618.1 ribosomal protein S18 acetylase RimI-like enzyme [Paenarthrobacter nitroguajacolicus]